MIIMPYAAQLHITLVRMFYQCINIFMEECCLYACDLCFMISHDNYPQASNINRTLVGNNNVDHSDVVGASPVGKKDTHLTYHSAWHLTFHSSLRPYSIPRRRTLNSHSLIPIWKLHDICKQWRLISVMVLHITVMSAMASQITSPTIFTQSFIQPQIKEYIKFRVTGLCAGNSPVIGEFPTQKGQ